ncbi:DUF6795 domain-containing protein [Vibrio atypicus]|uniref:DUF6795 domain-containing protein n=1 Tax=Vibrio atypicus TaxID=558271 RepID=UPI00373597EB
MFGIGVFKQDVELSPEIIGRLTHQGKPVANAIIARTIVYEGYKKGKEQLQHTTTNSDGRFSFSKWIIKSRYPNDLLGQNSRVSMDIYYESNNQVYQIWYSSSDWKPLRPPLPELLVNLTCDLNNKEINYEIDTRKHGGQQYQLVQSICYFDGNDIAAYYKNELVATFSELK